MGLNPLEFLLYLEKSRLHWQERYQRACHLTFQGISGYDVFAKWDKKDEQEVMDFFHEHQEASGVSWRLMRN